MCRRQEVAGIGGGGGVNQMRSRLALNKTLPALLLLIGSCVSLRALHVCGISFFFLLVVCILSFLFVFVFALINWSFVNFPLICFFPGYKPPSY